MKLPNVEYKHMTRASDAIMNSLGDNVSDFLVKENPGMLERLQEQQTSLRKDGKSLSYITAFTSGFYSCWFLVREALKDEELN